MNISLINYTQHAKELLIFSKNTRHLTNTITFADIKRLTDEEKDEQIGYVFSTIGSSLEFVNYTFLLQDVTRALTHQLVRHRVGTSFAQQSLRVAPADNFSYLIPDNIEENMFTLAIYNSTMGTIQENYNLMLEKGADIQDARGVLPTNICTNILMGINLRAFSTMMETRLCVRAQGEFQEAAMNMRELLLEIHPWAEPVLYPPCVSKGLCQFPRFKCPLKSKYDHLKPIDERITAQVSEDWAGLMRAGYSPQPIQQRM